MSNLVIPWPMNLTGFIGAPINNNNTINPPNMEITTIGSNKKILPSGYLYYQFMILTYKIDLERRTGIIYFLIVIFLFFTSLKRRKYFASAIFA